MRGTAFALRVDRLGNVAHITLPRPERRCAITDAGWISLTEVCQQLATDDTLRAVTLQGEGANFCAGADIHELRSNIGDPLWLASNQRHVAAALDAYAALPQPTIAIIRGCCFGGGAALAIASDFRLAGVSARFAVTPARLGLTYRLVDCLRLTRLVGPGRAREMLLLAREIDAATADIWGMLTLMSSEETLAATAAELMEHVLALSGYSQRGIKASLLKIAVGAVDDDIETRKIFEDAFAANDFLVAADAFARKTNRNPEK